MKKAKPKEDDDEPNPSELLLYSLVRGIILSSAGKYYLTPPTMEKLEVITLDIIEELKKEFENDNSLKENYENAKREKENYFSSKKKKEGKFITQDEALYFGDLVLKILRGEEEVEKKPFPFLLNKKRRRRRK